MELTPTIRDTTRRALFVAVLWAGYAVAFLQFAQPLGLGLAALAVVPAGAVGLLFGARGGAIAALAFIPAHTVLLNVMGVHGWDAAVRVGGPGTLALGIVGVGAGVLADLRVKSEARRVEAERAHAEAAVLAEATRIVAEGHVTGKTYERVLAAALRVVPARLAALALTREAGQQLELVAYRGGTADWTGILQPSDRGIAGRAFRTGVTQLVPDVRRDPDYVVSDKDTRSHVAVPVRVRESVVGVLYLEDVALAHFTRADAQLLETLAVHVGIAVEARRMIDEIDARAVAERQSAEQLRAVLTSAPIVLFAIDRDGIFTLSEGRALSSLGLRPGEVVGRSAFDLYADHPTIPGLLRRALAGEEVVTTVTAGHGTFEVQYSPRRDAEGQIVGVVGVALDVTERRRVEDELERLALHDALTGLPNRELLHRLMQQAIMVAQERRKHMSLLVLDLERFKDVNSRLGQHAGDILLQQLADRLRTAVRGNDVVARLGGDEFAILLTGSDAGGARRVVAAIQCAIAQPFVVLGTPLSVAARVGLATHPDDGANTAELFRSADAALYAAKASRTPAS